MADPALAELIRLCERVLAAAIDEDELRRAWPEEPADQQLAELRQTLFSGAEHRPGTVVNGQWQLDRDAWRGCPEHDDVEFYLRRLRAAQS